MFESLKSYFQKGGIIYGGSAGAIVLGKNILTSPDKNTYLKNSFDGLDLIDGYSVWCHYKKEDNLKIIEKSKILHNVLALAENSGFIIGQNCTIIGDGAYIFSEGKKLNISALNDHFLNSLKTSLS